MLVSNDRALSQSPFYVIINLSCNINLKRSDIGLSYKISKFGRKGFVDETPQLLKSPAGAGNDMKPKWRSRKRNSCVIRCPQYSVQLILLLQVPMFPGQMRVTV